MGPSAGWAPAGGVHSRERSPAGKAGRQLGAHCPEDRLAAARALLERGKKSSRFVVLKGGHVADPRRAVDLFVSATGQVTLSTPRRPGARRGTGCTFTMALLAGLCLGKTPLAAAQQAKRRVLQLWAD